MMLGIIKRNFKYLTVQTFVLIYNSMVRSHLDYCSSVAIQVQQMIQHCVTLRCLPSSLYRQQCTILADLNMFFKSGSKSVPQHKTMLILIQQGQITTCMHLSVKQFLYYISTAKTSPMTSPQNIANNLSNNQECTFLDGFTFIR